MRIDLLQPSLDNQKSQRSPAIQIFTLQTGYTRRLTWTRVLTGFELAWLTLLGYGQMGTEDWRKEGKLEHSLADSCWCANLIGDPRVVARWDPLKDRALGTFYFLP